MLVSLSQSHGALPIDARGAASVKQVRHDGLPVVDDEGEGGVHASSGEVREGGWELQAEAGEVRANNGRAGAAAAPPGKKPPARTTCSEYCSEHLLSLFQFHARKLPAIDLQQ